MGRKEGVRFASGKETCAAGLFRPDGGDDPVPCVVMASGLSCVRDQRLDIFAERFAEAGFAVLAFDYRHFGDSQGEPRSLMRADRQRADWRAAMSYARSRDWIDRSRIAIWGFSLGGAHVQSIATTEPEIAAAIAVAPLIDGVRTLRFVGGSIHGIRLGLAGIRDGLRALRGSDPFRIPVAGVPGSLAVLNSPGALSGFESVTSPGSSWRNELCARAALAPPYRLARKTRRIACPILYCLTEDDDINPPELGKLAARRAPRGSLLLYPGGHFAPFLGDTFERMVSDQIDFLGRTLGAPAS
jgi:pimeloyl-ACP methyl ester carboxylesterase